MEKQCSQARAHQRYLNRKSLSLKIGIDQNRHQDRRAEHREHMLQT